MLIRLLRTYLAPYKRMLVLVIVLQIVQTIANLYLPHLNADIIDKGITTGNSHYIWTRGAWMLLLSLVQILANIGAIYFGAKAASSFARDLRKAVFSRVQSFSTREVGQFGAPTLITRNTNDVQQVQMVALTGANFLASTPITIVGGVIMALREDAGLSWLLLICVPAMVGTLGSVVFRLVPKYRIVQKRIDKVNQVLREQLTGMRVVRAFVREDFEAERFDGANKAVTQIGLQVGRLQALMFPIVQLVFGLSSVAVLWFGAHRISSGHLEVGGLIAFLTYLTQILLSVMFATFVATMIPRAVVCANRIGEILDTHTSVVPPADPVALPAVPVSLTLDHVGFRYPGASDPVLKDVSFRVRAGETTAIVGSTGAGKSTLLNVIARLVDATEGSVSINGIDVRQLSASTLASSLGVVPQQAYLFSGTVASNLRYGKPDATEDELWHALRVAQGEDFVRKMAEQLDAPIAQGGTTVSGGQRQRLAIARALVHKPGIYLFDDSFSALDLATDARLREALVPETRDAAVVVVAQRITSIRHAHQIVVLDHGEIKGIGTHAELMASCETYQEIVKSQMSADEAA